MNGGIHGSSRSRRAGGTGRRARLLLVSAVIGGRRGPASPAADRGQPHQRCRRTGLRRRGQREDQAVHAGRCPPRSPRYPKHIRLPGRHFLRIRVSGEVLVSCGNKVVRLSSTGSVLQTYSIASYPILTYVFGLSLDPDGTTFWTADRDDIVRINIATGAQVTTFNAAPGIGVIGLTVYGTPLPPSNPVGVCASPPPPAGSARRATTSSWVGPARTFCSVRTATTRCAGSAISTSSSVATATISCSGATATTFCTAARGPTPTTAGTARTSARTARP